MIKGDRCTTKKIAEQQTALGILLAYGEPERAPVVTVKAARRVAAGTPVIGVIGAGQYAGQVLLPLVARSGARLHTVVSAQGVSAAWAARKFGFERAASETELVLEDPEINTVLIATRHDTHGMLAAAALARGKHVFVEKPLARSEEEIGEIARQAGPILAVGLNRRFAPLTGKLIAARRRQGGACQIRMLINAGAVPASHWTQRAEQGGGRILGEGCHFIDLARAIAGAAITDVAAMPTPDADGGHLWMEFADGSTAAIDYVTSGHRSFPKERVEVIAGGRMWVIDNFRRLESYPGASRWGQWWAKQEKGQAAMMERFLEAVRAGGPAPVPIEEVLEVARWTIAAAGQLERR
ncbi:MAG: Gfo/Idh/MocA family oxidoreductase [Bryobacter sp.]|nr:Gfo/Idh/MocA family oxidoreductase [Bryobacter sp.]